MRDPPPFSKYDPDRPAPAPTPEAESSRRRSLLLRYGQWISLGFMLLGFVFLGYYMLKEKR